MAVPQLVAARAADAVTPRVPKASRPAEAVVAAVNADQSKNKSNHELEGLPGMPVSLLLLLAIAVESALSDSRLVGPNAWLLSRSKVLFTLPVATLSASRLDSTCGSSSDTRFRLDVAGS